MPHKITLLLADDTLIAREGWQRLLEMEADLEVVGEVTTALAAIDLVQTLRPDVLLMDLLWFEDKEVGIRAIGQCKRAAPETRIIAISAYPDLIQGAVAAGADSTLPKGFSREQLLATIHAVVKSEPAPLPVGPGSIASELSARELDVLPLMAAGLTDREIAGQLIISLGTAKNHVRSIIAKLGAANRTQAASIARAGGLLKTK